MDYSLILQKERWLREQDCLKEKIELNDNIPWMLSPTCSKSDEGGKEKILRYIGGLDISFAKEDSSISCCALVILERDTLSVVYEDFEITRLTTPYIPGFLAFREGPSLLSLLNKMRNSLHPCFPQVIMVDGNGILHPRGCGLACHLGVSSGLPSIGIGKNLHLVDGLTNMQVKEFFANKDAIFMPLKGNSGQVWGAAIRSNKSCSKPIFVSVGHRLSLDTAINVVKCCCKYRIPEPIRLADIRSKQYLKEHYPYSPCN